MLADLTILNDHDLVDPLDRREPVGDDERGPIGEQAVDRLLDQTLGRRVKARRGLVQHDYVRVPQEDAGEGQELGLSR